MKKILLIFFTFLSIGCFAQFSKTHYIPPITAQNNLVGDHYLYISTPSTSNVNIKIIEIGGAVITGVVSNTNPFTYNIGQGNNTQLFTPKTAIGVIQNKGYIVEAENLIYASVRVNAGFSPQSSSYSHAGGLVSKGNSALGKIFRLGAMLNPLYDTSLLNFASILSTENNTKVTISNIPNGTILTDGSIINGPIIKTLNKNESYVLALENDLNTNSNSAKMIGALVETDKPVVVNSGSFGGSNSTIVNNIGNPTGRDVGFDQIVSFEKTGKEYIFVKGIGTDELERVLLIANKPMTAVSLNGTLFTTLNNPGDYVVIDGSQFSNGNLYVSTSENVFAYQSIGGINSQGISTPANQNLFFVPPLNCATPNTVDNIPKINEIGTITNYSGSLNIVTEAGAAVTINGNSIAANTAVAVTGNPNYSRYTISNLSGNITVNSTKQVYVSYYGNSGVATYGGYYSGFDTKPEIVTDKITVTNSACIPNVILKINSLSSYDTFQWIFNDVDIPNATTNTYTPSQPGYYQVRGSISGCGTTVLSDKIPVSICTPDLDGDGANNNVDIDNDNDGITNCTESYGNLDINISSPAGGTIATGLYSNSFTGVVSNSVTASSTPFTGNSNGSFVTEVPAGKGNFVSYKMTFAQPLSLGIEYVTSSNSIDLLNADAEYIINSDINKTITVLNPTDQLLIDTNYDGIYESGITEFSSFEIRFRLNSSTPLAAGTGTFKFLTYLSNSVSFTHKNLSDSNANKSTLKFFASCVPKYSDGDGTPDQLDLDSDNDGIPDSVEAQGPNSSLVYSTVDVNKDGLSDAFGTGFNPVDTDSDTIKDYLDLDSDNDGIYDAVETGSVGTDTDGDGIKNYRELDSDNDLCPDVIEAGFTDSNGDGVLGSIAPPNVDSNGLVTSRTNGYTPPNSNYTIAAPIVITIQPIVSPTCELQNATVTVADNGGNTYRWELSTNGSSWTPITNDGTYSGATTNVLLITIVKNAMNGYKYRVQLNKVGNSCGLLSSETTLTVYALPIVNSVTIVQCDDDTDGFSNFNLTVKNNTISPDPTAIISYYTSFSGAENSDPRELINDPLAFKNTIKDSMTIWARTKNSNACFSVSQIDLVVSTTQIPPSYNRTFETCDDLDIANDDTDGVATFDFSSVTTNILSLLPVPSSSYSIKYYKNEADALSESNEITNTTNYRNDGYRDEQKIWVRVESTLDNACYGLGPHVTLTVNAKPKIDTNEDKQGDELVCSNLPTFFVTLDAGIQDGSAPSNYTYVWKKAGISIASETAPTLNVNQEGDYTVEVSSLAGCSRIRTIKVTASDVAQITNISLVDLSDSNSITINATGPGQYKYSIDALYGPFQESNFFDNVSAGIHEVYITDINGCGTVSKTVAIIGIPKFFTPNGDGHNDYWNLKGVNAYSNSKSILYIYDRYGKLLYQADPSGLGWDGNYNKAPLPADDYWFTVKLEDGREAKGHFSLKR